MTDRQDARPDTGKPDGWVWNPDDTFEIICYWLFMIAQGAVMAFVAWHSG